MWPQTETIFGPRGIIWPNLVEVHQMMLHSKYQGSRSACFRQEDFFVFSLMHNMLNIWPHGAGRGRIIFSHKGTILTKIVSEYDQEITQSQTADNPVASRGRAAQPSRDTRETN